MSKMEVQITRLSSSERSQRMTCKSVARSSIGHVIVVVANGRWRRHRPTTSKRLFASALQKRIFALCFAFEVLQSGNARIPTSDAFSPSPSPRKLLHHLSLEVGHTDRHQQQRHRHQHRPHLTLQPVSLSFSPLYFLALSLSHTHAHTHSVFNK